MTNNPDFHPEALADAVVELTAPDGTVYRFRYGAVLPYAGQEYVVLVELEDDANGEEQLLITRLHDSPEGELSFEVVTEDDVIQAILQKYTEQRIRDSLDTEEGCGCGCGHEHQDGPCSCGHNNQDGCGCGNNHQDGCGCGHDHDHHSGCCGNPGCTQ